MRFEPLNIWINGAPATLTTPKEQAEAWKWGVARGAAAPWNGGFIEESCHLALTFHLPDPRFTRTAMVNLLKPTIDGLANQVFAPGGPGRPGPWTRADHWIVSLEAGKVCSVDTGAHLVLAPTTRQTDLKPRNRGDGILVSGRPEVWVSAREREWKEQVAEAVKARFPEPLQTVTEVWLSFRIHAARIGQVDLDNLVYPAIQAIARTIYRPPHGSRDVYSILAEKRAVDAVDAEGLLIGIRGMQ